MKIETVDQFLNRGGVIQKVIPKTEMKKQKRAFVVNPQRKTFIKNKGK